MTDTIKRCLWGAALSFLGMVGICIFIHHSTLATYEYGISEFGAIRATQLPFFLGFAAAAVFFGFIAWQLRVDRFLSKVFLIASLCLVGIAITSYPINRFTYDLHWCFVVALGLDVLTTMAQQAKSKPLGSIDYVLVVVFITITIISFLPILRHIPILRSFILREVIGFIAAFWFLGRAALSAAEDKANRD